MRRPANGEQAMMPRREALLALLSGGAVLGAILSAPRRSNRVIETVGSTAGRPRLLPLVSDVGSLSEGETRLLWQLAVATGSLWSMSELSESELRAFVDLKTRNPPSYLAEYRSALELFTAASQGHVTPEAVEAILRHPHRQRAAEHARQFVVAEFIALHLASGGFHQFGLTRFRGFIGGGYRVSPIQPGAPR